MLPCLPLVFTHHLDASAVDQKVQPARARTLAKRQRQCLLTPTQRRISGTGQSRSASLRRLATNPVACRNGRLNRTFNVRHSLIALSKKRAGRPGLPHGAKSHCISGQTRHPAIHAVSGLLYTRSSSLSDILVRQAWTWLPPNVPDSLAESPNSITQRCPSKLATTSSSHDALNSCNSQKWAPGSTCPAAPIS